MSSSINASRAADLCKAPVRRVQAHGDSILVAIALDCCEFTSGLGYTNDAAAALTAEQIKADLVDSMVNPCLPKSLFGEGGQSNRR